MKKNLLLIALLLISCFGFSQDIIIFREKGNKIKSKVTEITETTIKYKKWENLDGPVYNIQISLVSMIKYANGQQEVFDDNNSFVESDNKNDKIDESSKNVGGTVKKYPKLSLKDVPYFFNGQNNSLKELESTNCKTSRNKSGAWGHMTVKSIMGIKSNIRFSKHDNLQFLIQLYDPKANPNTICELVPCEINGQREFIDSKEGAHGKIKQSGITLEFKKINDTGLYLITVPRNMSKGEYFFSITDQNEVYAFGLDN